MANNCNILPYLQTPDRTKKPAMAKPNKCFGKWRIRWADEFGKRRSEVFDSYKDAEYALKQHELQTEYIKRGLSPSIPDKLFEDVCDNWLKYRAPQKRSGHEDESIIRCHLLPYFKNKPLKQLIKPTDLVNRYIGLKTHLAKKTVINHLTLFCSILNHAYNLNWISQKPVVSKPRIRRFYKDFSYLRNKEELDRFLYSARMNAPEYFPLYMTAVHTGMRAGELSGLQWSDIDYGKNLIFCQRSYDGPTKAEDVRYIPILAPLRPVLLSHKNSIISHPKYVFTNSKGDPLRVSDWAFKEVFHKVLDHAGFKKFNQKQAHYFRFHDLRHSFASHWMINGGDIFKLKNILGHKSIEMTQRYAHFNPDTFKEDLDRFGTSSDKNQVIQLSIEKKLQSKSRP